MKQAIVLKQCRAIKLAMSFAKFWILLTRELEITIWEFIFAKLRRNFGAEAAGSETRDLA